MPLTTIIDRIDLLVTEQASVSAIKPHLASLRDQAEALELQIKLRNQKTLSKKMESAFEEEAKKLNAELAALQSDLEAHKAKAQAEAQKHQEALKTISNLKKQLEEAKAQSPKTTAEEWPETEQRILLGLSYPEGHPVEIGDLASRLKLDEGVVYYHLERLEANECAKRTTDLFDRYNGWIRTPKWNAFAYAIQITGAGDERQKARNGHKSESDSKQGKPWEGPLDVVEVEIMKTIAADTRGFAHVVPLEGFKDSIVLVYCEVLEKRGFISQCSLAWRLTIEGKAHLHSIGLL